MSRNYDFNRTFAIDVPAPGPAGTFKKVIVRLIIDTQSLAQDLGYNAWHNKKRVASMKRNAVILKVEGLTK